MARHELLVQTIGVFEEEIDAYWLAKEFSWILPTIILSGGLMDMLIIGAFMRFLHPWKDILFGDAESGPKEADHVQEDVGTNSAESYGDEDQDQGQGEAIPAQDNIR